MIEHENSSIPGFVAELVRAANEADHLTMKERSSLMMRSAITIADMGDEVAASGAQGNARLYDFATELRSMAVTPEVFSPENVSSILLSAAEAIRTLKILSDSRANMTGHSGKEEAAT